MNLFEYSFLGWIEILTGEIPDISPKLSFLLSTLVPYEWALQATNPETTYCSITYLKEYPVRTTQGEPFKRSQQFASR